MVLTKPLDMMEKLPDFDRTVTPPVTPQLVQKETPTEKTPTETEKKKKKKKRKSKEGEAAGPGMSTSKKMGPKEATLRDVLDVAFEKLDEGSAVQVVQAIGVSLQEVTPMKEE